MSKNYKKHFCKGEKVWMPVCKECIEEKEK